MLERAPPRGHYDRQSTASQRAQEQRELILRAISAHLVACRPEPPGLTISALCKATGLGRNTVYGHFESVKAAEQHVLDEALSVLDTGLSLASGTTTPLDAVRTLADAWTSAVAEQPRAFQVAVRWMRPALVRRLQAALQPVVRLGVTAGLFAEDPSGMREPVLIEALLAVGRLLAEQPERRPAGAAMLSSLLTKACR